MFQQQPTWTLCSWSLWALIKLWLFVGGKPNQRYFHIIFSLGSYIQIWMSGGLSQHIITELFFHYLFLGHFQLLRYLFLFYLYLNFLKLHLFDRGWVRRWSRYFFLLLFNIDDLLCFGAISGYELVKLLWKSGSKGAAQSLCSRTLRLWFSICCGRILLFREEREHLLSHVFLELAFHFLWSSLCNFFIIFALMNEFSLFLLL